MSEKPTLVIGDVHGHFDRLEALLRQEGILGTCPDCNGSGDAAPVISFTAEGGGSITFTPDEDVEMCSTCNGDGQVRVNHDARVIQLGDLGHFGGETGSPTGDYMCYDYARKWIDEVLWGNHDRAMVDSAHSFKSFMHPGPRTKQFMDELFAAGRLKMATAAHGYLIVHAGVHLGFYNEGIINPSQTAESFADYLNGLDHAKLEWLKTHDYTWKFSEFNEREEMIKRFKVIDGISPIRGGGAHEGGVLWMDWRKEKHLRGEPFKYICGHTADKDGLLRDDEYGNWNIDIGGKKEPRLGGLWLADGKIQKMVKVEL